MANSISAKNCGDNTTILNELTGSLEIPFRTSREAEIAYNSLRVDKESNRSGSKKEFVLKNEILQVNFTAQETRQLRVAINSFLELLILVIQTIEKFGPPKSKA